MSRDRQYSLRQHKDCFVADFFAMASPCELHLQMSSKEGARKIAEKVCDEVWRIEDKYSRYNSDSVCSKVNASAGSAVSIDNETFLLLTFASQCFHLSDGLFDISSGVLRQAWNFDGGSHIPTQAQIDILLPMIGWDKIEFDQHQVTLLKNMELDFGGIGKEYAVDKAMNIVTQYTDCAALVNLGGDLACSGTRTDNLPWQVGVECPGGNDDALMVVSLNRGALATSGDAKRFLERGSIRYSHILDATTGWPVANPPRSMTVAADTCMEAGVLATLSMLQGCDAEIFLENQQVQHWAIW